MTDSSKTNTGLAKWAMEWLGRPYWYGTCVRTEAV